MFDSLYIGATGMRGQQTQIDAIAQNVANLTTVGYRRGIVTFNEVVAAVAAATPNTPISAALPGTTTALNIAHSLGAGAVPTLTLSLTAGAINQTNDPMNIAINGLGFLEVKRADGTPAYTRAGQLTVNSDGLLAAADGSSLVGRVAVPSDANNLQISATGQVSALVGNATTPTELGQLELVGFSNAGALESVGNNLYVATSQSGDAQIGTPGQAGLGTFQQGFLESSNVQMTDELVNLMLAQRVFELNSKVMQASDQMLGLTNGLYR